MKHVQVSTPMLSSPNLINHGSSSIITVVQPRHVEPILYYAVPNINVIFPNAQEQIRTNVLNCSSPGLSFCEDVSANKVQTSDWIPVVESTFSLSELINESNRVTEPSKIEHCTEIGGIGTIPINVVNCEEQNECHCIPVFNDAFFPRTHEAVLELWNSGGDMNWLNDPYIPSKKKRKDLEEINLKSVIKRADIKFTGSQSYIKSLSRAVVDIINTRLFIDWLLLKCEVTKMEFACVKEEVTIHSTDSLNELKNAVYYNSCLPLPLVIKNDLNLYQYFYFVFNYGGNPIILKLNRCLFAEVDITKTLQRKVSQIECGILLNNNYINKMEKYTFYAEPGFDTFLRENEIPIRRILHHHIVWGYLQCWVRKMVKLYKFMLTVEEVAEQLSLCLVTSVDVPEVKDAATRSQTLYLVGFIQDYFLYLKFFSLNSYHRSDYSISIKNFETDLVSEVPIIQYFRQYFYVGYSSQAKVVDQMGDTFQNPCNPVEAENEIARGEINGTSQKCTVVNCDKSANVEKGGKSIEGNRIGLTSGYLGTDEHQILRPTSKTTRKPLIKARTVEEINASIEGVSHGRIQAEAPFDYPRRSIAKDNTLTVFRNFLQETTDLTSTRKPLNDATRKTKNPNLFLDQVYKSLRINLIEPTRQRIIDSVIDEKMKYNSITGRKGNKWAGSKSMRGHNGGSVAKAKLRNDIKDVYVLLNRKEVENYLRSRKNVSECLSRENPPGGFVHVEQKCPEGKPKEKCAPSKSGKGSPESDVLYGECVSHKVSVVLPRVEDLVDFKRIEEKTKTVSRSVWNENILSNKKYKWGIKREVKGRNKMLPRKTCKTRSESLRLESQTVALLWDWKNKRRQCKEDAATGVASRSD